jgi:16S rRNA (cytosine1402-N4)-methyltransferase
LVVISFHSLEERMVKRAFQNREIWSALTKKPMTAGEEELQNNPRSRSAKMRAAKLVEPEVEEAEAEEDDEGQGEHT